MNDLETEANKTRQEKDAASSNLNEEQSRTDASEDQNLSKEIKEKVTKIIESESSQKDESQKTKDEGNSETEMLSKKTKELTEQLSESKEQLLRLAAEFDNYKKRQQQHNEAKQKYANENIAKNLFNVTDSLERAIEHVEKNSQSSSIEEFVQGIQLVHQQFIDVLKEHHIKKIDALGEHFDPEKHEAVSAVETDEAQPNQVISVFKQGYLLHDRVIRPAMVQVSKNKADNSST